MAVSRASGIVQMPARASKMQSILFSTQNTYVTSPAGRPCAGLIGFRAKKGICKTTGVRDPGVGSDGRIGVQSANRPQADYPWTRP